MKKDRYYQWLPNSGNDGEIVKLRNIFLENDIIFYEFSDGEICNEEFIAPYTTKLSDLQNKLLVELASKNDVWETSYIKSKSITDSNIQSTNGDNINKEIPPLEDIFNSKDDVISNSNIGKFRLIAPKEKKVSSIDYFEWMSDEDLIKLGLIKPAPIETPSLSTDNIENDNCVLIINDEDVNNNTTVTISENDQEKNNINNYIENDPISILVKASYKKEVNIPMEICIELPSKELFNIAKNNFDNGELKFIDVILADIDYDTFKNSLREALINAYNSD